MIKACANCQKCKQYIVDWDVYPEFGCKDNHGDFKKNTMGFPSEEEGCDFWELNTRNKWTE